MITLEQFYMGRKEKYASQWNQSIETNAIELLKRVNQLLAEYGSYPGVSSGWRPPSVNAAIPNAAKKSSHMVGQAIDLKDPDGKLDAWLMANQHILDKYNLWLESPTSTPGWCHLDTHQRPHRVFLVA